MKNDADPQPQPDETPAISSAEWSALMHKLARQAERSLWWMRKGTVSADDTAMSTLRTYLRQTDSGELPPPSDPDSLWPVLEQQLTRKIDKAAATQRYLKNKKAVRYSEMTPQLDGRPAETGFSQQGKSPEDVEAYVAQALSLLSEEIADEHLLQIARLKLECHTTAEIAQTMELSEHQVRRRLAQIRGLLEPTCEDDPSGGGA
ncbi:ECF-type sigma factor [Botrimarina hoheduenensis]|uniref:ECF sigma factor n=1 Tax=Botrimarina hoheduenensis TaxID=2528000 RepID=A0A5C5WFT8_9BACT|nr:ECF-type sigma factor [Botrimarina hoheduenensis]TWT48933.1 ECF sigma factor [Botrimarina hoheduenensis]